MLLSHHAYSQVVQDSWWFFNHRVCHWCWFKWVKTCDCYKFYCCCCSVSPGSCNCWVPLRLNFALTPNFQLGFMAPDGTTNLAVKDLVNALQFLKQVLPAFGGDPNKVTIAGQSSGASLVRTLLAVPSASSLFHQGIIQSDPMVSFVSLFSYF